MGAEAPTRDLNQNGSIDTWEVNRLVDLRLAGGEAIHENKLYKVTTIDFLVAGGDDLGWFMAKIPASRIHFHSDEGAGTLLRDTLINYLTAKKRVNTSEAPLIDLKNPRLIFKKPVTAKKTKHRKKRRK